MLIDITKTLNSTLAVWPGDVPFELRKEVAITNGDPVNVTRIITGAHVGTHIDAPYHFDEEGITIEQLDLEPYWGKAQVITINSVGALHPSDFADIDLSVAPRLLIRTPVSDQDVTIFPPAFAYPTPETAALFAEHGIILYGSDSPSVDPEDGSTDLAGHHALHKHNVLILEGLMLKNAPDGVYELSAFPLKLEGGDGSPVRAVLRTIE